jgi:hypothetical protein
LRPAAAAVLKTVGDLVEGSEEVQRKSKLKVVSYAKVPMVWWKSASARTNATVPMPADAVAEAYRLAPRPTPYHLLDEP